MKSLVLILGAGSSCEVGLPSGWELRNQIARLLDIRYDTLGSDLKSGDNIVNGALHELAGADEKMRGNFNELQQICWRICSAMPQAISIDNYIDSHRHDLWVATIGKIAIVRAILLAERNSQLMIDQRNVYNKMQFNRIESTWFAAFFKLLTEGCNAEEVVSRIESIGVITFNYDRCLEHYLLNAFENYYGINVQDAAKIVGKLEIYHPYGAVGSLPLPPAHGTPFGVEVYPTSLNLLAKGLRTFTQGVDPALSNIDKIRGMLAATKRIAFLGFAFHPLNVDLLFPEKPQLPNQNPKIFATAFSMSRSDCAEISVELMQRVGATLTEIRNDLKCADLFNEFRRSLSLR